MYSIKEIKNVIDNIEINLEKAFMCEATKLQLQIELNKLKIQFNEYLLKGITVLNKEK